MLSTVIHAELPDEDPPRLSYDELSAFFSLLFSAGAETTRNAIAGAMLTFREWPDQLALLREGDVPMRQAVEEILRWTTPSPSKRRTATEACQLGGRSIEPGRRWWCGRARPTATNGTSPNRMRSASGGIRTRTSPSATASTSAWARISRLELRVALEEVLASFDRYELAGPVEWTRSNRHSGVRHLPLRVTRRAA
jgi:cytochrome P450